MGASTLAKTSPETDHRYRTDTAIFEMPAEFKRPCFPDSVIANLLNDYHATGSLAARDSLIGHLLPVVMRLAQWRRKVTRFHDELDELISDGCAALSGLIDRYSAMPAERFLSQCHAGIRWAFVNGAIERGRWRKQELSPRQRLTKTFRQKFIRENGRVPTADETHAFVATLVDNPNIEVKPAIKKQVAFSVLQREGTKPRQFADANPTVSPMIDRDTINFALKGLVGADRKIFRPSVIDGLDSVTIAKQLGMSRHTMRQRINGLLWNLRCRSDLARSLNVEPAVAIPLDAKGRPVAMKNVPPARLAG